MTRTRVGRVVRVPYVRMVRGLRYGLVFQGERAGSPYPVLYAVRHYQRVRLVWVAIACGRTRQAWVERARLGTMGPCKQTGPRKEWTVTFRRAVELLQQYKALPQSKSQTTTTKKPRTRK